MNLYCKGEWEGCGEVDVDKNKAEGGRKFA